MSGLFIRLRLFIKLWFTSIYSLSMMLLIPIVGLIIYNSGSFSLESLTSIIYEKAAPIWYVFIIQWCFAVEMDSKFYYQLFTYPIVRWRFIFERMLFSSIIFFGLLTIVTIVLTPILGSYVWRSLAFTVPVYVAIGGFVLIGTMIGHHSIGGLFAGIIFWMMILFGGALLRDFNAILLGYLSVYDFVSGQMEYAAVNHQWIMYNRLFYLGVGVLCMLGAVRIFNRKSI